MRALARKTYTISSQANGDLGAVLLANDDRASSLEAVEASGRLGALDLDGEIGSSGKRSLAAVAILDALCSGRVSARLSRAHHERENSAPSDRKN
jgi:hypothetical protein